MWFIFRVVDRVLLYYGTGDEQFQNELAACLANEGGHVDDFVTFIHSGPIPDGLIPAMNVGGQLHFIPNPKRIERAQLIESATAKLTALGLSVEEINVIL